MCLSGRSPCEKQDIKHVGVCGTWQTLVKDAIPTIKKRMTILYKQVPDEIKLYVDNSKGPAKALKQDDMISKYFNIDHIEEGLILIYLQ
ncbi:hypothetical protein RIR_jg16764.t1 [Rhizophagus irregularis DAOM 181602=DAOM 197198]|nr:hypothetical protein RIR_jg16764.t1 [Rhizophagus irregularis DAOM 181602=DAOM 197198]